MTSPKTAIEWEREYDQGPAFSATRRVADDIMLDHRSVVDRAREVIHASCMNPDEHRSLVREIAKAISDAEIRGIKNCKALLEGTITDG